MLYIKLIDLLEIFVKLSKADDENDEEEYSEKIDWVQTQYEVVKKYQNAERKDVKEKAELEASLNKTAKKMLVHVLKRRTILSENLLSKNLPPRQRMKPMSDICNDHVDLNFGSCSDNADAVLTLSKDRAVKLCLDHLKLTLSCP